MLLNELDIAQRIGMGGLPVVTQKKRIRKMIKAAAIEPKIFDGGKVWMIPETMLEKVFECPLKSAESQDRHSGTSEELSAALRSFRVRKNAQRLRQNLTG